MLRVVVFAATGVVWWAYTVVLAFAHPDYQQAETLVDWLAVLSFSAGLFALAFALPMFAQLVGGRSVLQVSFVPATGAALAGFSNLLEDGLHLGWAFAAFVLGALLIVAGLTIFAFAISASQRGRRRFLGAVPLATLVGQLAVPAGGGILLGGAWLAAAAIALAQAPRKLGRAEG